MDLTTTYLGLELKHPVVASAGPLSSTLDGIRRLEEGGAAAIVLFSLFEEQIRHDNESFDYLYEQGMERFPESLSYFPKVEDYHIGPEGYLNLVRSASEATDIPIIGSLNGATDEGWRGAKEEEKETLELVSQKRLSPQELANARTEATELDKRAYKRSVPYRKTEPAKPL